MSSVSSRSKANRVRSTGTPVGAIIASACLIGLAKGLSVIAKAAFDQTIRPQSVGQNPELKSVSQIRAEAKPISIGKTSTEDIETLKGQVLAHIASRPFWSINTASLDSTVAALNQASTLEGVEIAQKNLLSTLEAGQQQIFTTTLLNSCRNAALKIGFAKIESRPSPIPSVFRLSATDPAGRSFVIEVTAPMNRDVRIETEVVGVSDGSCNAILDDFDKALEAQGVRSQTPKRKYTGGVCETAAVRDFLADKITPKTREMATAKNFDSNNDVKRTQRLNQKTHTVTRK